MTKNERQDFTSPLHGRITPLCLADEIWRTARRYGMTLVVASEAIQKPRGAVVRSWIAA